MVIAPAPVFPKTVVPVDELPRVRDPELEPGETVMFPDVLVVDRLKLETVVRPVAVMRPAEKFPTPSRRTNLFAVLRFVASMMSAEFRVTAPVRPATLVTSWLGA